MRDKYLPMPNTSPHTRPRSQMRQGVFQIVDLWIVVSSLCVFYSEPPQVGATSDVTSQPRRGPTGSGTSVTIAQVEVVWSQPMTF